MKTSVSLRSSDFQSTTLVPSKNGSWTICLSLLPFKEPRRISDRTRIRTRYFSWRFFWMDDSWTPAPRFSGVYFRCGLLLTNSGLLKMTWHMGHHGNPREISHQQKNNFFRSLIRLGAESDEAGVVRAYLWKLLPVKRKPKSRSLRPNAQTCEKVSNIFGIRGSMYAIFSLKYICHENQRTIHVKINIIYMDPAGFVYNI